MKRSLRLRLVASLGLTVLVTWVAAAVVSYLDARDRIGHMLDDHLVQAAHLLLGASGGGTGSLPPAHWGEDAHALLFQAWSPAGHLLFHSADAPAERLSTQEVGYSEVERGGVRWQVYGARGPEDGTLVQVAERADFRRTLAGRIAAHLLVPSVVALPVLGALIWLAVGWALGPLRLLARDVERRDATDLEPLERRGAPVEVQPLVRSLDALFERVGKSMESERRFTADAAHELRTPLSAIRTHAEVALAAAGEEERSEALSRVVQGTVRANRVVEQLLTLARLDARELAPVLAPTRLDRIVLEQVGDASVQPAAAERNLGVEGPLEEALVWGDADLLAIALRNLLDNALRYTRPGDSVDVSVRGEGERVVLVVEDSGLGLPPAQREHVLGRFVRGQGTGAEGSGIGLSIVARIAALHGATLTLGEAARGGLSVEIGLRRAPSSS